MAAGATGKHYRPGTVSVWGGIAVCGTLSAQQLLMLWVLVTLRTTYSNKSNAIEPSLERVPFKINRDLLHSKQVHLLGHLLKGSPVDSCCSVGIQGP